jgi:hypothetical protein
VDTVTIPLKSSGASHFPGQGRRWGYIAVGVLIVTVGILVAIYPGALSHQIAVSVKRQPTPYASLYFKSPGTLPSDLSTGTGYPLTFTVANHDVRERSFRYEVTLTSTSDHETVDGNIVVPGQGDADKTVAMTPVGTCPCKMSVALPTQRAMIYFTARGSR